MMNWHKVECSRLSENKAANEDVRSVTSVAPALNLIAVISVRTIICQNRKIICGSFSKENNSGNFMNSQYVMYH